jgi:pyruvate dehydrogenase E1 component beta subunit
MDTDTVLASVARTGRLLVVHEAVGFGGVGAELVATVAEHGSHHLKSPMRRLAPQRRVYPPAESENDYLIGVADIVGALKEMCG